MSQPKTEPAISPPFDRALTAEASEMARQLSKALRILRMKHLIARTGLSRATLYSLMNPRSPYFDPAFPKKIQISVRSVGFLESELDTWIQLRIASGKKQS